MSDSDSEDIPPELSDEEPEEPVTPATFTEEVEQWCSSLEFDPIWGDCFDR